MQSGCISSSAHLALEGRRRGFEKRNRLRNEMLDAKEIGSGPRVYHARAVETTDLVQK